MLGEIMFYHDFVGCLLISKNQNMDHKNVHRFNSNEIESTIDNHQNKSIATLHNNWVNGKKISASSKYVPKVC